MTIANLLRVFLCGEFKDFFLSLTVIDFTLIYSSCGRSKANILRCDIHIWVIDKCWYFATFIWSFVATWELTELSLIWLLWWNLTSVKTVKDSSKTFAAVRLDLVSIVLSKPSLMSFVKLLVSFENALSLLSLSKCLLSNFLIYRI